MYRRHGLWIVGAGAALALLVSSNLTACRPPAEETAGPPAEPAAAPAEPAAAPDTAADPAVAFAAAIEAAHGLAAWRSRAAVQLDIVIRYGGQIALDGRLTFPTDLSRSRLRLADGTIAVFDGERAWVSSASSKFPNARFHLLTWPYFLAAPMKLRDPGARLEPLGERPLRAGESMPAARLTFDPGTGDTPDDWYVLYRDPASDRLAAVAYIATYGTTVEEAEQEPHQLVYGDFVDLDGVPIPTAWLFYQWSEEQGGYGDPIADATLTGVRFVTPAADAFSRPTNAREDPLPGTGG